MPATTVNLDNCLALIAPWDFSVTVGGQTYATRPLTLADLAVLASLGDGADAPLDKVVAFLGSVFADPKPDVTAWTIEHLIILVDAIGRYVTERSKKNQAALRGAGPAAAPPPTTPTGSTPFGN